MNFSSNARTCVHTLQQRNDEVADDVADEGADEDNVDEVESTMPVDKSETVSENLKIVSTTFLMVDGSKGETMDIELR